MINFPSWIPDRDCHSPTLLDLLPSYDASICSVMAFFHWAIVIMLSQFPLSFCQTQKGIPRFITQLMTILLLIGAVFVIIWKMFF